MSSSIPYGDETLTPLRVSTVTRLLGALVFSIPAIGGAIGSVLLMRMFSALKYAETAGILAVMNGMKEASLPVIISFCLAAVLGLALLIVLVVRMFVQTRTASPPFWFFAVCGLLTFVPAAFFWRVQFLIIEILSPGSSLASNGIAAVGAEISVWLLMSMVAAPVVVLILLVLSVIPFSSTPGRKIGSALVSAVLEILLIVTVFGVPFLIGEPKRKNEIVNLPVNVKYADHEYDIEKATVTVITVTSDGKLYKRTSRDLPDGYEKIESPATQSEIPAYITKSMEDRPPDKRIVYLKCDLDASFELILSLLKAIRSADVDRVGLAAIGRKNEDDPYQISPLVFPIRLPAPADTTKSYRPNPLTLVAAVNDDHRVTLNNEEMGTIANTSNLQNKLTEVFKARENNGVFRAGTNEIEKTVFVKVVSSTKYGDLIKLLDAVRGAGAEPIGIQIDNDAIQQFQLSR